MLKNWLFVFFLIILSNAQADKAFEPVTVKIINEHLSVEPNSDFRIAIHFSIAEGWHLYPRTEENEGMYPDIEWNLSEGSEIKQIDWPETNQYYKDSLTLVATLKPATGGNEEKISLLINWVACNNENCVPGDADITLLIPKSPENPQLNPEGFSFFSQKAATSPLLFALLFAFSGGVLLNLMPCVLPVLSFKILGFVQLAGEEKNRIFHHGLAFTAGVLCSFWTLASVLLMLKSYGHSIGWGFQLQEPLFVGLMAFAIFLFGLSLFGLFEMGTKVASFAGGQSIKQSEGLKSSFFSGILATAIATPCTGPFLGAAVGFALTQSSLTALLVFSFLGGGLAAPYLILSRFPTLLQWVPKPGNWMVTFKEATGFIMVATVLWLLWVFAGQTGTNGMMLILMSLLLCALAAWIFGRWGSPVQKPFTRTIGRGVAITLLVFSLFLLQTASKQVDQGIYSNASKEVALADGRIVQVDWEPFSMDRLEALIASETPVFVDFTAKWCLICQTNHLVVAHDEVQKTFAENQVVQMIADWTKKDDEITRALAKYGRSGVPLYLYFPPGKSEPIILPQILTKQTIIEIVEKG